MQQKFFVCLVEIVRGRLRVLRRGESSRKKRWKTKRAYQKFLKNPYQAGKDVLDPVCSIQLQCNQSSLDVFKAKTLCDPSHDTPLPPLDGLPPTPALPKVFNSLNFKP